MKFGVNTWVWTAPLTIGGIGSFGAKDRQNGV